MVDNFYLQALALFLSCFHYSIGCHKDEYCLRKYPTYFVSVNEEQLNYYGAVLFCRSKGLELVSVESQEEQDYLNHHLANLDAIDKDYWTSGSELGTKGTFRWLSTGKTVRYTNWRNESPIAEKNCLMMNTNGGSQLYWTTDDCAAQKYFVCEGYNSFM